MAEGDEARLVISLPGGRVARLPRSVVEQYVDAGAAPAHAGEQAAPAAPATASAPSGAPAVTIHIHVNGAASVTTSGGGAAGGGEDDRSFSAHNATVDPMTGASVWHTDWEQGWCTYTDEAGFPQTAYIWHRHPLGTEYAEAYR